MESLSGIHHFYEGIIIALIGFFLLWGPRDWIAIIGIVLIVAGIIIMVDDAFQHAMERFYKPGYESPLKVLFSKYLWQYQWVKDITRFCDRLFGKNY